jgi:hypothetical protein
LDSIFKPAFKVDTIDVDFAYQYTFRKSSIASIFEKNFASAAITIMIFQYNCLQYMSIFSPDNLVPSWTEEEKFEYMEENLVSFKIGLIYGNIIAGANLITVISQFVFNAKSPHEFPFDIWSKADMTNALINMTTFVTLNSLSTEQFLNPNYKFYLDYMMVAVQVGSWYRFGCFLILFQKLSVLLLTLITMFSDA